MPGPELGLAGPQVPDPLTPGRGGDAGVYGLLTLAGVQVALPLAALREVVPCPEQFADLPVSTEGLLGAMSLRTLVVPVVDLRSRLGVPAERHDEQVVVLIAQDDQLLGLLADGVRGITRVAAGDLRAVQAVGTPLLFTHSFRDPSLGCVVSVLHVSAVLDLPGLPTVHDPGVASHAGHAVARVAGTAIADGPRRTLTLLRCSTHVLGIEVAHVHTTLSGARPRPSVLDHALCRGVTQVMDREVPVLDPLVLLGLGELPPDDSGAGVVLQLEHGYVVLALSAVLDIREVPDAEILPLPAFAVRRPDLFAGITDVSGLGQCLVLSGDALRTEPDLQAFSSVNTTVGDADRAEQTDGQGRSNGPSYLTYSVGTDVATPLEQVVEIVPFPTSSTATGVADAVLGVVVHRRAAVPLLCLSTILGLPRAPVTSATCLLLVEVDGTHTGFAVHALRTIDRRTWQEPPDDLGRTRGTPAVQHAGVTGALHASPLVCVGDETRLLPDLDLRALARAVRAGVQGPLLGPLDANGSVEPGGADSAHELVDVPAQAGSPQDLARPSGRAARDGTLRAPRRAGP